MPLFPKEMYAGSSPAGDAMSYPSDTVKMLEILQPLIGEVVEVRFGNARQIGTLVELDGCYFRVDDWTIEPHRVEKVDGKTIFMFH